MTVARLELLRGKIRAREAELVQASRGAWWGAGTAGQVGASPLQRTEDKRENPASGSVGKLYFQKKEGLFNFSQPAMVKSPRVSGQRRLTSLMGDSELRTENSW